MVISNGKRTHAALYNEFIYPNSTAPMLTCEMVHDNGDGGGGGGERQWQEPRLGVRLRRNEQKQTFCSQRNFLRRRNYVI